MADFDSLMITLGLDAKAFKAAVQEVTAGMKQMDNAVQKTGGEISKLGNKASGTFRALVSSLAAPLAGALSLGAAMSSYTSDIAAVAKETGAYNEELENQRRKRDQMQRITKYDIELYKQSREVAYKFESAMADLSATFMRTFGPAVQFIGGLINKFSDFVKNNQNNITRFLLVIGGIITTVMIPAFVKWAAVMLTNPITWLVLLLVGLALVIDDLITYIQGGESAFGEFWSIFGTGPEIAAKLQKAWETLKAVGIALWEALKSAITTFFSYFTDAIEPIKNAFLDFVEFVRALFDGNLTQAFAALKSMASNLGNALLAIFIGAWNLIRDAAVAAFNFIRDFLSQNWDTIAETITNAFSAAWEAIKTAASAAWDAIKDVAETAFSGIADFLSGLWDGVSATIISVFTNAFNSVYQSITSIFSGVKDFFSGIFDGVLSGVTDAIKGVISNIPDFLMPEGLKAWASSVDNTVKEVGNTAANSEGGKMQVSGATLTQAAVSPQAEAAQQNTTNNVTQTASVGSVVINTQATDAQGIANGVGGALKNSAGGVFSSNTGVRQ